MANPLEEYFWANADGRLIHKWLHYFEIYHRHFEPYRGKPITVVEFGVFEGGSLQMWRDYFGEQARIVGIDVDSRCQHFADVGIEIVIGDQEDRTFLRSLRDRIGPIDVLIDDGGHTMRQQIATFEEMFPALVDGGVFLVEDLHTSYRSQYGGGYRKRGTFIEYAKDLIDQMHAWHAQSRRRPSDLYTRQIRAMHVYDSIIVFDKGRVERPSHRQIGQRAWNP